MHDSTLFDQGNFEKIIAGRHFDPTLVLGPRTSGTNGSATTLIRAFLPMADRAWVINDQGNVQHEMRRVHSDGLFQHVCQKQFFGGKPERYRIRYAQGNEMMTVYDPYSFGPLLSDLDLHLHGEGKHDRIYERLGAHVREVDGVKGVTFAVWAPNAQGVSLVGSFNDWDGRRHPMKKLIPAESGKSLSRKLVRGTPTSFA